MAAIWLFLKSPLGAGLLLAALFVTLIGGTVDGLVLRWEKSALQSQVDGLQDQINNPKTGWRAQLTTCQGNEASLNGALGKVSDSFTAWRQADAVRQAQIDAALAGLGKDAATARTAADKILALQPKGDICQAALGLLRASDP
jgi:hypothetical protein